MDLKRGDNVAANQNTENIGSEKEGLEVESYAELKEMFTNPQLIALYGDDLLAATWKASFKHMPLDCLQSIDREQVPERFHLLINEVVETRLTRRTLLPSTPSMKMHNSFADHNTIERWRQAEHNEGRQVVFLPTRSR